MEAVTVRGVTLGEGRPKIILPIVAKTKAEILTAAEEIKTLPADLVEWRIDWFEGVMDQTQLLDCLADLRTVLGELPLLVTFRTAKEGGERAISNEDYADLYAAVSASGHADLIDVEAFTGDEVVTSILQTAHAHGVKVVASNHDFFATPPQDELVRRLTKMQELGADIPKIAVMPRHRGDVMTLLSATETFNRCYAARPIITMSMGGTGVISRLCGQAFGSCATFGCAQKASAPGQVEAARLDEVLHLLETVL